MPKSADCLSVHVTMGSIDRAMRIYDAAINAVQERGDAVEVQKYRRENYPDPQYHTVVLVDGELVEIELSETTRRVERTGEGLHGSYPRYEFVPSGRLSLAIKNGTQSRWGDSAKHSLESLLGKFVHGVAAAAVELKDARRRREEFQRQQLETQRRQWEESERRRAEAGRVRALNAAIDLMHGVRWVLEYLAQLKENLRTFPDAGTPEMQAWLTWVEDYASRVDPAQSPPRVPKDPNPYG